MPISIHHLSTNDIGGAARAGLRLHHALNAAGASSSFLVRSQFADEHHCFKVPEPELLPTRHRSLSRRIIDCLRPSPAQPTAPNRQTYRSMPHSPYRIENFSAFPVPDVYNLHWVAGFLDWEFLLPKLAQTAPIVWTLHDLNPLQGLWHYTPHPSEVTPELEALDQRVQEAKISALGQIPDHRLVIVGPSRWLANLASNRNLTRRFQVQNIPYGIDLTIFYPIAKPTAREILGIPPKKFVIGMIADDLSDPRKGGDVLQEALHLPDHSECFLLRVGKVPPQNASPSEVIDLGPIHHDSLLRLFYSALDVFVCPSREDNLPNTVMEAMACGTPVVGSSVGGIPDMVREGENGWLFKSGDATALCKCLADAKSHPDQSVAYGLRSREIAEQEYHSSLQSARYLSLYKNLLQA